MNYNLFNHHVVNIWQTTKKKVNDGNIMYVDDTPTSIIATIQTDQTIKGRMDFKTKLFKCLGGQPILLQFDNELRPYQLLIDMSGHRHKISDLMKNCWAWVTERAISNVLISAYNNHQRCSFSFYDGGFLTEAYVMQPIIIEQDHDLGYTPEDHLNQFSENIMKVISRYGRPNVHIDIADNIDLFPTNSADIDQFEGHMENELYLRRKTDELNPKL